MLFVRSALFSLIFPLWTGFLCFALLWALVLPRRQMIRVVVWWVQTVYFLEKHLIGLDYEVRGRENLPEGACLVAAKHQSAWETMKIHLLLKDPAIIMKRELLYIPIWGWYTAKAGMIAVNRGKRGQALLSLIRGARRVAAQGRPIVIFPQGTRVPVGETQPYKVGVGILYESLNVPIVPMALNSGLYWPKKGFLKRPGKVIVEFLPPILPGKKRDEAMKELEERLEAASNRLSSSL